VGSDLLEELGSCTGIQWGPPQYDLLLRKYVGRSASVQLSVSCRQTVLHNADLVAISVSHLAVLYRSRRMNCRTGSLFNDGAWAYSERE
jgi:hypothetical protein